NRPTPMGLVPRAPGCPQPERMHGSGDSSGAGRKTAALPEVFAAETRVLVECIRMQEPPRTTRRGTRAIVAHER
ncbi:MAG: hypothetical protein ACKVVP_02255, partial [Chloroflexota bacterium]